MDQQGTTSVFLFNGLRLDRRAGGLFRQDGTAVSIGARALDVLGTLVARPGDLVSRREIMAEVWPGIVVDDKNLAVQISALRRVLDNGTADQSCIHTEPGRGYRFIAPVTRLADIDPTQVQSVTDINPVQPLPNPAPARQTRWFATAHFAAGAVSAAILVVLSAWGLVSVLSGLKPIVTTTTSATEPPAVVKTRPTPRLSVVVLPFRDLSTDTGSVYHADALTDDLATELSLLGRVSVVGTASARTYRDKVVDARQIGPELGVRYVLQGTVRRIDATLRINIQLAFAESGEQLWSGRFDEPIRDLLSGQSRIIAQISDAVGISMTEIESARALRERPTNPNAVDLLLRAHSLRHLPQTPERDREAAELYRHVQLLDPLSVPALVQTAYYLIDATGGWQSLEDIDRAEQLLAKARRLEPGSLSVLNTYLYWLRSTGRCTEVIEAAEDAMRIHRNRLRPFEGIFNELSVCKGRAGHMEDKLALQAWADELNPRSPWRFTRYAHLGFASLMLGRDREAIDLTQRAIAMNPDGTGFHGRANLVLAAAHARLGQFEEARRFLTVAERLLPYFTVRSISPGTFSSGTYDAQLRGYQVALRLVGARENADEAVDFKLPADASLQSALMGPTPMEAQATRTIHTAGLVRLLADSNPVVIDTMTNTWSRSIEGAVGLRFAGLGGSFTDLAQERLGRKMAALTAGHQDRPIVAVGWNAESFDGRNLALRLSALGYTRVYWYRGGREAWEVAGHPETMVVVEAW